MNYTKDEVRQFVEEEDVKFIRLTFCDVFGRPKNISIMAGELERAFSEGIAVDAWAVPGFEGAARSDIILHPDPATLAVLPWRPEHGRVIRMFCDISWPDGTPFICDTRGFLRRMEALALEKGYTFLFGTEQEFYLMRTDMEGEPAMVPFDRAGYMDVGPVDRGENIRREICMTLEQMGIRPESSHHEEGPGQNEIDFAHCSALKSADDAQTFRNVVSAIAARNGAWANFSPKPLEGESGNGMHINFSALEGGKEADLSRITAGILEHIGEMTLLLNPEPASYRRLGRCMAPGYITWGRENRSALIRIPAASPKYRRGELRSPDPMANPYLAYGLMIGAGLEGLEQGLALPAERGENLYRADEETLRGLRRLPATLEEAAREAARSPLLHKYLPEEILQAYLERARALRGQGERS